jgi:hypothetical protein
VRDATIAKPITCCLLVIVTTNGYADRLIRRSDGEIALLGLGTPDAKKDRYCFKSCNDRNSKIFSLKEYFYQAGKDCGPPKIFGGLESIKIDGTEEPSKAETCSTGKSCLRYIVKSSDEVETIFAGAKKGDKIELTTSDFDKTKLSTSTQNVNLMVRFVPEKTGQVKETLSFTKIPASGDFVNMVTGRKASLPK